MKRLIALVPGGKSKLGSMAAAFVMLREDEIQNITESEWDEILEDSPINSTSGVEGPEKPIGMLRRNWKDMDCFAGCHVFDVEGQTFSKYKRAKEKFERWENFISDEDGEQGKEIIKFSKTYPSRGIILKEKGTGAHVILKTPKK